MNDEEAELMGHDAAEDMALGDHIDARDAEVEALRAENERLFSFVRELANNPRKPATWMQTREAAAAVIAALGSRT